MTEHELFGTARWQNLGVPWWHSAFSL